MEDENIKKPSKIVYIVVCSFMSLFTIFGFFYYICFSVDDYPAEEDLIPVLSNIKDYELKVYHTTRGRRREHLDINFEDGVELVYHDISPKFHIIKILLAKDEDVVFYVDKSGKYRNWPSNRLRPLTVESQGVIIASYKDFVEHGAKKVLWGLYLGLFFLFLIFTVIFEYFWVKRKYEKSLLLENKQKAGG